MSTELLNLEQQFPKRGLAVAVLFLAAFMNTLDVTIVNLALPTIQEELNATPSQLEWVLIIYVLTFAAGLLPFGRFGDVLGRNKLFGWGLIGFIGSSGVCGVAPDITTLITARAAQGFAGAMMVPQVLAIVHVLFEPEQKGKVISLFGTISGLGAVTGPVLGGFLVSADIADLSWRAVFLINLPLGIISLVGALLYLPKKEAPAHKGSDWGGAALFAFSILAITYPLVEGRLLGWPWWCFALMLGGLILLLLFSRTQILRARKNLPQVMPANLLKDRFFLLGLGIVALFFSGTAGVMFMLAVYLQSGFGLSAQDAGVALAAHPAGVMIASFFASRLANKWLEARLALGALTVLLGMIGLVLVINSSSTAFDQLSFLPPLLLVGMGMGTSLATMFQLVLSRVASEDAGAGSGILQAFQQVGVAVGIAVIGQIFFSTSSQFGNNSGHSAAASAALQYPIGIYVALTLIAVYLWKSKASAQR
ncbi:MFS transporter [Flexibacterium corallicola]|uniref:MFS transporter n=1 Tax=Flexibacterium corallicola TaxID=3037259 RepID=UPI00286EB656|nr:MFS transporter [Pseudovibrio sp. M1P-2-3]